jgi:transcriptional regulator with XRE-family HTH domain
MKEATTPRTAEGKKRAGQPRTKPNMIMLKARIQKGLTRDALGQLAGLTEKQVGLIERGKVANPHIDTAVGLAEALEVDVLDLFPPHRRIVRK